MSVDLHGKNENYDSHVKRNSLQAELEAYPYQKPKTVQKQLN